MAMTKTESKHVNTAEAMDILRCSASTLRRYARDFNLTRVRLTERHVLYVREELLELIEKRSYRVQG